MTRRRLREAAVGALAPAIGPPLALPPGGAPRGALAGADGQARHRGAGGAGAGCRAPLQDRRDEEGAGLVPGGRPGLIAWLDERTGWSSALAQLAAQPVPGGARWRYVF